MKKLMLHKADSQDQIYDQQHQVRDASHGVAGGAAGSYGDAATQNRGPPGDRAQQYSGRGGDGYGVIASNSSSAAEIATTGAPQGL